jgi:multicomponent K+:H+ antiporter subunit F
MSTLLSAAILLALSCYAIAGVLTAVRLFMGPAAQDRVLALDSAYMIGLLVILTLGIRYASNMYFEVALLVALFGFVSSTAMAKFLLRGEVIE